jgi:ABC-2 type transport system ATP-binding protein
VPTFGGFSDVIEVRELTRRFSGITAVDSVSFTIERGEIVGFLGPNGAGKTTTLRMLTCFLPPTSGTARIAGHDIHRDPMAVRRNLGYLPESVPLYADMRVDEYLKYRAQLKGVPRGEIRTRMLRVAEQCRIGEVRGRLIAHLSKGYRQRVGMADALIHDPPILFLDEPTSGLDPNQIREVRGLIAGLGEDKTVVISTHILPEVEATCRRVLIIDRGKIVADGGLDELRRGSGPAAVIRCAGTGAPAAEIVSGLKALPGVQSAEQDRTAAHGYVVRAAPDAGTAEAIAGLFAEKGWALRELHGGQRRLEEVFWHVTGFEVGDGGEGAPEGREEGRP